MERRASPPVGLFPNGFFRAKKFVAPHVTAPFACTRSTVSDPPLPRVTLFVPAATDLASEVVKAGHEIKTVPEAGEPSARKTVSLTRVVTGAPSAAFAVPASAPHQTSNTESIPIKNRPSGRRRPSNMPSSCNRTFNSIKQLSTRGCPVLARPLRKGGIPPTPRS